MRYSRGGGASHPAVELGDWWSQKQNQKNGPSIEATDALLAEYPSLLLSCAARVKRIGL
jgi:hypothetical protein